MLDDKRGTGGQPTMVMFHTKGITMSQYEITVTLSSGGLVLGTYKYLLWINPTRIYMVDEDGKQ